MTRNGLNSAAEERGWLPEAGPVVCCVSADDVLREECARVAAVAGVEFEGVRSAEDAPGLWYRADLVLLGPDVAELPPQRRSSSVLVGRPAQRRELWQRAASLGIDHVAELPDAADWLVEFLSRRSAEGPAGSVLGILGGCGGAGASTTASLVSGAVALAGTETLLVDGDRLAGGLEASVAAEPGEGLRWPDLASASGAINPRQLADSLPRVGDVGLLSWPAAPGRAVQVPPSAIAEVLEAARTAFDLVVVDIGRGREGLEDFAWTSDRLLVVVPGTLSGALSAAQLLHELPPVAVGAVVRGRTAEGIDAEQLAELVGCPLVGQIPHLRRAAPAADAGRLMELARLRPVRSLARAVLDGLPDGRVAVQVDDDAALALGARLVQRGRRAAR